MKKNVFFIPLLVLLLLFNACSNDIDDSIEKKQNQYENQINDEILKKEFSIAFSKLINISEDLRSILKEEALKEIDYDTDVLYILIKDMQIENGKSIEESLSEYLVVEKLKLIEEHFPTLTIFVPTLVDDLFSAEKWDIKNEIPAVTYLSSKTRTDLPILFNGELVDTFYENEIPGSPIVVIKENERIVKAVTTKSSNLSLLKSSKETSLQLAFLDETFNNQSGLRISRRPSSTRPGNGNGGSTVTYKTSEDYKILMDAYDEFGIQGWQRDKIYYDLTKQKSEGPLNKQYGEYLVAFEMRGDGLGSVRKISDQADDPQLNEVISGTRNGRGPAWTDGEFEFKVTIYLGTKSPVGSTLETFFRAKPSDIFRPSYDGVRTGKYTNMSKLYVKQVDLVRFYLPDPLPLFIWDLEKFSPTVKITMEEVDVSTSVTKTFTNTSEFATNFSFDLNWGDNVKKGLKFGGSAKETNTSTYTTVQKLENDELGELIINFEDPVILSKNDKNKYADPNYSGRKPSGWDFIPDYNTRYHNNWYGIYLMPDKLYK